MTILEDVENVSSPPAPVLNGIADRSSGKLAMRCPHCDEVNEFPGWWKCSPSCHQFGDPVNVVEPLL